MDIDARRAPTSAVRACRSAVPAPSERFLDLARRIARECFGPAADRVFAIRYWNGFTEHAGRSLAPPFTILVRRPGALRAALCPPSELAFAETFVRGDLDLEGDLEAAVGMVRGLSRHLMTPTRAARIVALASRLPADALPRAARRWRPSRWLRRHDPARDAAAVRHHYDVSNEFYRLWLDAEAVYSCAYFEPGNDDLAAAQQAKLDYICRKLELRPGDRFLDVGCGWGGLIRHAACRYAADAVGITVSRAQAEAARERIAEDELGNSCRVDLLDYRDLPPRPVFHKAASVGMVEHVGRSRLNDYFDAVFHALRPGGLFLHHGIIDLRGMQEQNLVERARRWLWREGQFLRRYVFPDGELPRLTEVVRAAEETGFEVRDLENLREHYVCTLRHWSRRLDAHRAEAAALVGQTTLRTWRLYLAASAHSFATGRLGVVQLLLWKPRGDALSDLPRTRHRWYIAGHGSLLPTPPA